MGAGDESRVMATYSQIQKWVQKRYGWIPKTCWIAHCKELCGLEVRQAPNRIKPNFRAVPCPEHKRKAIKTAFQHLGMIE